MRWPQDAAGWPMAEHSRFVHHRPHRWHLQEAGQGETLLLVHGAGGATQSWRGLFPRLARFYHVVAIDLPGQGFTQSGARSRSGLDAMAEDIISLCRHEGIVPRIVIGHSAGAAIALRMAELGAAPQAEVIGINAALANFKGVAGWLFPMLAKVLALSPFAAGLFAASATEASVRNLIRGTGSDLDAEGIGLYLRLAQDQAHVDGTLAMMAQWQLDGLLSRLPALQRKVTLITGDGDLAVPPRTSVDVVAILPEARHISLAGLGHLAHEEDPDRVFDTIRACLSG
jgi:magnesium chelatase accessory protein